MLNKNLSFWKEIENQLQLKGYDVKYMKEYAGRFFEVADYVLATNAPKNLVIALIGCELEKGDTIDKIEQLSMDELGKDHLLYY